MGFVIDNTSLMEEWDFEKNKELGISPTQLTEGSNTSCWWKCKLNHSWRATIPSRMGGCRCPYCHNKKVLVGFNDLATTHPIVASEWHRGKNDKLTPQDVVAGSNKRVWWQCSSCDCEWECSPNRRTNRGAGCPRCARKIVAQKNSTPRNGESLQDLFPDLLQEWGYDKNILMPNQVKAHSSTRVWWRCKKCGHEWMSTVANRTNGKTKCPMCTKSYRTSFPEMAIYFYIKKYYDDAIWGFQDKDNGISEIDVFIPSLSIGIEYDGSAFHKNVNKDTKKDNACVMQNIKLFKIREPKCPLYESSCTFIYLKKYTIDALEEGICKVLSAIGMENYIINLNNDYDTIINLIDYRELENSVYAKCPHLIAEWNTVKNDKLTPTNVSAYSKKKVWWNCCVCGFEWQATVGNRSRGSGCPECSRRKRSSRSE